MTKIESEDKLKAQMESQKITLSISTTSPKEGENLKEIKDNFELRWKNTKEYRQFALKLKKHFALFI